MAATKTDLRQWFDRCKADGDAYMLVYCDTFDYEDYPVGVTQIEYWAERKRLDSASMQRFMESYDLQADREEQMTQARVDRHPPMHHAWPFDGAPT